MRWNVTLTAEGDREMTQEEIVELADAVAGWNGVASGIGTTAYAASVTVDSDDRDEAVGIAEARFSDAVARAGLPRWSVTVVDAASGFEDDLRDSVWDLDTGTSGLP